GRLTPPQNQKSRPSAPIKSTPISLFLRDTFPHWLQLCHDGKARTPLRVPAPQCGSEAAHSPSPLNGERAGVRGEAVRSSSEITDFSPDTALVLETLTREGALFFGELTRKTGLLPSRVEQSLPELVAHACTTSDSFAGWRPLL